MLRAGTGVVEVSVAAAAARAKKPREPERLLFGPCARRAVFLCVDAL